MALVTCPECQQKVSSQATTCPHCGFPIAQSQAPDLGAILCAGPWLAQSGTLVDAQLQAGFFSNGTFQGRTTPDPNRVVGIQLVTSSSFTGTWQVAGAQLFFEFPLTMGSGPAQTQIAIQFTRISKDALSGVDSFGRPWEWKKRGQSSGTEEELLGKMYTELARMRVESLKKVAADLGKKDAAEGKASRKTRNKKS
jgi:hypothetical protein